MFGGRKDVQHTKFVVVKMRELLKTAVFAVLGVIILVGLITFFLRMGAGEETGQYRDGTYEAAVQLGTEQAVVSVEINDGKIAQVTMQEMAESVAVMYPMVESTMDEIAAQVIQNQSAQQVDVSSQQTYSAQVLLDAVAQCLAQAEA